MTRQALLDELTPTRRMRLHRHVGDALERAGAPHGDPEALAYHFAEAARDGRGDRAAHYALIAGRRAIDRLAYEEAIGRFEVGIEAALLSPEPNARLHVELKLALTDALLRHGAPEKVIAAALAAAAGARSLGDASLFARAAVMASFVFWLGQGDTVSSMLREALDRIGSTSPIWRTRLLARLATEIAFSESDIGRAMPCADEALTEARRLGDPETVAFALVAAASVRSGTPEVARIASLLDEVDATLQRGDLEYAAHLSQVSLRASNALERGDIIDYRTRVRELDELATSSGWRGTGRLTRAQQVVVAYLAGDLAEAQSRNAELLENYGDHPNALNAWAANAVIIARDLGRQSEVLPMVAAAAHDDAGLPGWRAALALLYSDEGNKIEARRIYEVLLADDLASLPDDQILTAALACLAEVAVVLDDRSGAQTLARRLEPFSGLVLAQATANFVVGVADRFLAMLAAAQGDWKDAQTRFEAALRLEERLESPTLVARTKMWYGRLLLRHHEEARARVLLEDAIAIATPLRLDGISGAARTALRACVS